MPLVSHLCTLISISHLLSSAAAERTVVVSQTITRQVCPAIPPTTVTSSEYATATANSTGFPASFWTTKAVDPPCVENSTDLCGVQIYNDFDDDLLMVSFYVDCAYFPEESVCATTNSSSLAVITSASTSEAGATSEAGNSSDVEYTSKPTSTTSGASTGSISTTSATSNGTISTSQEETSKANSTINVSSSLSSHPVTSSSSLSRITSSSSTGNTSSITDTSINTIIETSTEFVTHLSTKVVSVLCTTCDGTDKVDPTLTSTETVTHLSTKVVSVPCSTCNATKTDKTPSLAKREGQPSQATGTKGLKKVKKEIKSTLTKNSESANAPMIDIMIQDDFLGALSTYMDIYLTTSPNSMPVPLNMFRETWVNGWNLFYKNNNHGSKDQQEKTREIGYMYILVTPTFNTVFGQGYQDAVDYLVKNPPTNKAKLAADVYSYIQGLITDKTKREEHIKYMLDFYYQYGVQYKEEASSKNKDRISNGFGAIKKQKRGNKINSDALIATTGGFTGLFGVGLTVAGTYGTIVGTVPLAAAELVADLESEHGHSVTYSASTSTTTSSKSTSSSSSQCTAADETADDQTEATAVAAHATPLPSFSAKAYKDFCNKYGAQESACQEVLDRHAVKVDLKSGLPPKNIYDQDYYGYDRSKNKDGIFTKKSRVPVYIVNQNGKSPGVACNALRFISNHYSTSNLFKGSTGSNGAEQYLMLRYGVEKQRANVLKKYYCPGNVPNDLINLSFDNSIFWQGWNKEEFPPKSASKYLIDMVDNPLSNFNILCVAAHDNRVDGLQLKRFYERSVYPPKKKQKCSSKNIGAGLWDTTNYEPFFPNDDSGDKTSTKVNNDGNAFVVLVNAYDDKGNFVDCSNFNYGSDNP